MSHNYRKIKYKESGPYGSTEEKYLYVYESGVTDITTFYGSDGTHLLSFEDTLDDNIFDKMMEIIMKRDSKNIERMTNEDRKICGL